MIGQPERRFCRNGPEEGGEPEGEPEGGAVVLPGVEVDERDVQVLAELLILHLADQVLLVRVDVGVVEYDTDFQT